MTHAQTLMALNEEDLIMLEQSECKQNKTETEKTEAWWGSDVTDPQLPIILTLQLTLPF